MSDTTTDTAAAFPYTKPAESEAGMFIQWKGTDVCLDFYCPCGSHCHFDGDFAYYLKCPDCGAVYEMGTQVIAKRVTGEPNGTVQTMSGPDDL